MKNKESISTKNCRFLKAKNFYGFAGSFESTALDEDSANIFVWCIKSVGGAGPDNQPVSPKLCKAGRVCFENPVD